MRTVSCGTGKPFAAAAAAAMFMAMGLFGPLFAVDDYSTWAKSWKFILNTSSTGANVTSDNNNFPVLVRLSSSDFGSRFDECQANGEDIRFSDASNNPLSYEIEQFDKANKQAVIWVLVPTVLANNASQYIKMYWGKSDASSQSNGNAVFDAANGYAGVWHLNENPAGGAANAIKDRTGNANNGTCGKTMGSSDLMSAAVGKGIRFDGVDDSVAVHNAASLNMTDAVTVSAWFKANALTSYLRIAAKSFTSSAIPYTMYGLMLDNASHLRGEISDAGCQYAVNGCTALNTTSYYYGTFTYDGSTLKLYLNGAPDGTPCSHSGHIATDDQIFSIGESGYNRDFFSGVIDEVQLSRTARSPAWIKLCYENQKQNQTLVQLPPAVLTVTSDGRGTLAAGGGTTQGTIVNKTITAVPWNGYAFASWEVVAGDPAEVTFADKNAASTTVTVSTSQTVVIMANFKAVNAIDAEYPNFAGAGDDMKVDGSVQVGSTVTVGSSMVVGSHLTDHTATNLTLTGQMLCDGVKIGNWVLKQAPDYVFDRNYPLLDLNKVEEFIKANGHLPEVPSAKEMNEQGLDMTQFNMTLLKKIEELTLYTIELKKEVEKLKEKKQ